MRLGLVIGTLSTLSIFGITLLWQTAETKELTQQLSPTHWLYFYFGLLIVPLIVITIGVELLRKQNSPRVI